MKNTYDLGKHSDSEVKQLTRLSVEKAISDLFPKRNINMVNLGGADLKFEKLLIELGYKLKGISYELTDTIEVAKKNAPKNINVIRGDIMNHKCNGNENVIWLDLMVSISQNVLQRICKFVIDNDFDRELVFAVTLKKYSRQSSFLNIYGREKYENFVAQEFPSEIAMYIENGKVKVHSASVVKYSNKDVNSHATDMVLYIFKIIKV
jgi:hypothetical protein